MINLLLPEEQKKLSSEYHHRLLTVAGFLISAWFIIILIIIGSLYWYIFLQRTEAEQMLAKVNSGSILAEVEKQTLTIKNFNDLVKQWQSGEVANSPSLIIKDLLSDRRQVVVQQLNYSAKSAEGAIITLSGKSPTRQQFLTYLASLEKNPLFKKINSPVKNLIQEKNISFTLEITL